MSRDWSGVTALSTVKEVRQYLAERHGVRLSIRTIYRYAAASFVPLPIHPESRPDAGAGTRGLIAVVVIDEWVEARFHLRRPATA
jgi:hypothetical protein